MSRAKAKTESDGIDISVIDDEKQYAVTLTKPIKVGRTWARPGHDPVLKGKIIKENADAVSDFTEA